MHLYIYVPVCNYAPLMTQQLLAYHWGNQEVKVSTWIASTKTAIYGITVMCMSLQYYSIVIFTQNFIKARGRELVKMNFNYCDFTYS